MGHAALAEVVKYAQAQYEEGNQSRQVRKKVTEAITNWASEEGFTDKEVELGLALATEIVARFGLSNEVLAELRFDPTQAANKVVASARVKDRYWGTENHYEVAARAIRVTYDALTEQLQASHDVASRAAEQIMAVLSGFQERAMIFRDLGVSRDQLDAFRTGDRMPTDGERQHMLALDACLVKLVQVWAGRSAEDWLLGANDYLDGGRPIDALKRSEFDEVSGALDTDRA